MNKRVLKLAGLGIGVVSLAGLLSFPVFAGEKHQGHNMHKAAATASAQVKPHSVREMHLKKLGQAIKAIDKAAEEVEAGNKDKALVELAQARKLVLACRKAMLEMGKVKIANALCPIMGTRLDPAKVPAKLTRIYKGKKIGFCCNGCPVAWDKLNNQQKQEKLGKGGTKKRA